jgi:hypothetical protein
VAFSVAVTVAGHDTGQAARQRSRLTALTSAVAAIATSATAGPTVAAVALAVTRRPVVAVAAAIESGVDGHGGQPRRPLAPGRVRRVSRRPRAQRDGDRGGDRDGGRHREQRPWPPGKPVNEEIDHGRG